MSRVVSMRLQEGQMERLQRMARRLGRTPSETSALLVDEALRTAEFAFVEFRDSSVGRQAYIKGSTLAVWEVIMVARDHGQDAARTAAYLEWPEHTVRAAMNYAAAFPDEISHALADNDSYDFEKLSRLLPQLERFVVRPADDREASSGDPATAGEIR